MSVEITSKLPADERNGLGAISAALCDNPEGTHVIIEFAMRSDPEGDDEAGDCPPRCPWHSYDDDPTREPDVVLIPLDDRPVTVVELPEPSREDTPA